MRKVNLIFLALVAIYLLAAPLALGQGETGKAKGRNAEEQIKTLTDQVVQAFLKGDTDFFEKNYADDALIIHADGKLSTKAQEIGNFKSGAIKYESIDVRERKIHLYSHTAVVTQLVSSKGTLNGKPWSGDSYTTRVWVKQEGGWKSVAWQSTRVAPSQ